MQLLVKDVIKAIDFIAPWSLAESWDNSGLQLGDPESVVGKIGVSLDVTMDVIDESIESGIDCLITHHPFFFKPMKVIDFSSIEGRIIKKSAQKGLSIISAHTNFDIAVNGLNDLLAERIGLKDTIAMTGLKTGFDSDRLLGIGRIGNFIEEISLSDLAILLKARLGLNNLRYVGDPNKKLKRAALCTGSGGSLIHDFFKSGADVYITGDIKYHEARDAEARGLSVLDIGHFGSEIIVVEALAMRLRTYFKESMNSLEIMEIKSEKEPFVFL